MKLSDGAFRHVEFLLYSYNRTKQEIATRRAEILYETGARDDNADIRSGRIGDPTGQRASVLASDVALQHKQVVVNAIDAVLAKLDEPQRELIKLKYWTKSAKYTWMGIGQKLDVHEKTCRRWRNDIVQAIAEKLGWE